MRDRESSAQKPSRGEECQRGSRLEARTRPSKSAALPNDPIAAATQPTAAQGDPSLTREGGRRMVLGKDKAESEIPAKAKLRRSAGRETSTPRSQRLGGFVRKEGILTGIRVISTVPPEFSRSLQAAGCSGFSRNRAFRCPCHRLVFVEAGE